MLNRLICPFCYHKFSIDKIEYRCQNIDNSICPTENDPKLASYFGDSSFMANHVIKTQSLKESFQAKNIGGLTARLIRKVKVPSYMVCDKCSFKSRKRICPNCHNQLPTYFHDARSHIISVVGARGSGKTHFITVLINELKKKGFKLNIKTTPQDVGEDRNQVTSQRYKRNYYLPLIEQGKELQQTQKNAKDIYPLIYEIDSNKKGVLKNKVLYLTFYDTAGENFNDYEELRKLASYLKNSSGIIFLLDTFEIREVRSKISSLGKSKNINFSDVFNQLENLLKSEGIIKKTSPVPMALTFSKIDEVIHRNLLNDEGMAFSLRDSSKYLKTGLYSQEEANQISNEMRSLLDYWGERAFYEHVERVFTNVRYFGVSALGNSPVNGRLPSEGIKPHRVLDPLIWILDELNFVLPKEKAPK